MAIEYLFYGFFLFMFGYAIRERRKDKEKPKSQNKTGVCPDCGQRLHRYDDNTVVCQNRHFWEI